jgi:hypothetical protein
VRDEVREVRLEQPERNRMIAGAIVGAAVGLHNHQHGAVVYCR